MNYNIVVARYNENIDWIYNIDTSINIYLYNKGSNLDIKLNNVNIINLGNVGRESHIYLYHIIKNYNNLSDIILFTQANYKDHYSKDITDYFNLINFFPTERIKYNFRNFENGVYTNIENLCFKDWLKKYIDVDIDNYYKEDELLYCKYGGIFSIKKENILSRSINYYKNLIYQLYYKNPEVGHYFERSWYYIFNIHRINVETVNKSLCENNINLEKRIWILWLQGWNNISKLQEYVLDSWRYNNDDFKIEFISLDNIRDYVNDIDYIFDPNKNISNQAKSDIIRLSLLKNHGGIWVDITLLCMQPLNHWIFDMLKNTGFWMYHGNGGGMNCDGPASWFIISTKDNYIINKWKEKCDEYWNKNNYTDNYFWMDGLFKDLFYSDNKFKELWLNVPYLLCELEGQSHTLCNGIIYNMDNNIRELFKYKPPYVLKLWNDYNNYMFYDKNKPELLLNGQYATYLSNRKYIYKHNIKFSIVIAKYKENVDWINNINKTINIYLYNKDCDYNNKNAINLPNIGRESHSYLYHIIKNYDNLDDIIIFTQGNYKEHNIDNIMMLYEKINIFNVYSYEQDENLRILNNNIILNRTNLNFSEWIDIYIEENLSNYLKENNKMYFNIGAIFCVKKENILSRSKDYYINLINQLNNINPEEGHFIERIWYYIFNLHK